MKQLFSLSFYLFVFPHITGCQVGVAALTRVYTVYFYHSSLFWFFKKVQSFNLQCCNALFDPTAATQAKMNSQWHNRDSTVVTQANYQSKCQTKSFSMASWQHFPSLKRKAVPWSCAAAAFLGWEFVSSSIYLWINLALFDIWFDIWVFSLLDSIFNSSYCLVFAHTDFISHAIFFFFFCLRARDASLLSLTGRYHYGKCNYGTSFFIVAALFPLPIRKRLNQSYTDHWLKPIDWWWGHGTGTIHRDKKEMRNAIERELPWARLVLWYII